MMGECHTCGRSRLRLGTHWFQSADCDYPDIPDGEMEMMEGLLMGDASIARNGHHPYLRLSNTNLRFLAHVSNRLGILSNGISVAVEAKTKAEQNRRSGFTSDVNLGEYHDVYVLRTRRHPSLSRMAEWYCSGEKRFPNSLELSPEMISYWYACDGHVHWSWGSGRPSIVSINEADRERFIRSMFDGAGFEVDHNPACGSFEVKAKDGGRFIDWMGEAVPGFGYKWEVEDRESYREKKNIAEVEHMTQNNLLEHGDVMKKYDDELNP